MSVCGEIVFLSPGCYKWYIHDFLSNVFMTNTIIKSPFIEWWSYNYWLELEIDRRKNLVSLSLKNCFKTPCIHVRFGMHTGNKGIRENRNAEKDFFGNFRVASWMPYTELIQRKIEILSEGKLTVFCEVTRLDTDESPAAMLNKPPREDEVQEEYDSDHEAKFSESEGEDEEVQEDSDDEATVSECEGDEKVQEESDSHDEATVSVSKVLKKLLNDLKNLLDSGEDCDVTIKVQGKEFPVHSIILRMRSPVFKSMFSHEMVEKLSGVVVIEDCDPTTFPDLLNYLYTGSTQHISDENVCQLYTASDKYQVEELKEGCAAYMKNHLSVGNFCDILTLALRHSEKDLIDLCTEFFCSNAKDIVKTATWQTFLSENTTVENELFFRYLSRETKM